jgi:NAD(P)-dependent dehydrogenase (short-subunit alcohol dehydrogenase family)
MLERVIQKESASAMQVNYLGHFVLASELAAHRLKQCASGASVRPFRAVTVSSMAHFGGSIDYDDLHVRPFPLSLPHGGESHRAATLPYAADRHVPRLPHAGWTSVQVPTHPGGLCCRRPSSTSRLRATRSQSLPT